MTATKVNQILKCGSGYLIIFHGIGYVLKTILEERLRINRLKNIFLLILNILLNSFASFLLKTGMSKSIVSEASGIFSIMKKMITTPLVIGGGVCFASGFLVYSVILRELNLSLVYPIVTSGSLIAITLISFFILKEPINYWDIIGFALIILGIGFVVK